MKKKISVIFIALTSYSLLLVGTTCHILTANRQTVIATAVPSSYDNTIQLVKDAEISQTINDTLANVAPTEKLPNFVDAAKLATPAVVHIKAIHNPKVQQQPTVNHPLENLFKDFFGEGFQLNPKEYKSQPQYAMGSGVIYTADGYIITNCHVIEGADEIEVTLDDNRNYKAKLIGKDAAVDLALLKIEEKNLPYLKIGSSDLLQVGDWVLAVGNPFGLNSTVTKGIVSAKSRHLQTKNAFREEKTQYSIQSFIQTDASENQS